MFALFSFLPDSAIWVWNATHPAMQHHGASEVTVETAVKTTIGPESCLCLSIAPVDEQADRSRPFPYHPTWVRIRFNFDDKCVKISVKPYEGVSAHETPRETHVIPRVFGRIRGNPLCKVLTGLSQRQTNINWKYECIFWYMIWLPDAYALRTVLNANAAMQEY